MKKLILCLITLSSLSAEAVVIKAKLHIKGVVSFQSKAEFEASGIERDEANIETAECLKGIFFIIDKYKKRDVKLVDINFNLLTANKDKVTIEVDYNDHMDHGREDAERSGSIQETCKAITEDLIINARAAVEMESTAPTQKRGGQKGESTAAH